MPNKSRYIPVFLLLAILLSACARKEVIVPSLYPAPTGVQLTGKFVWYDLFTYDMDATVGFYNKIFGWTFIDTVTAGIPVKTLYRNGIPIANAVQIAPGNKEAGESRWLGYISVPDVDEAAKTIKRLDGTLYRGPRNLPDRGRIAIAIDSEGAIFGLVHSPTGDPLDQLDNSNNFIGSELWTTDTDSALALYKTLAGYELEPVDLGDGGTYNLLTRDTLPRAGLVKIPWDDVKPSWVAYIGVPDLAQTIIQVKELGGRVLIQPPEKINDRALAIVADSTGAVFGIQQLRNTDTAEGGNLP